MRLLVAVLLSALTAACLMPKGDLAVAGPDASPEQAGPDAKDCPACGRRTIHQHCAVCMACGYDPHPAPKTAGD